MVHENDILDDLIDDDLYCELERQGNEEHDGETKRNSKRLFNKLAQVQKLDIEE